MRSKRLLKTIPRVRPFRFGKIKNSGKGRLYFKRTDYMSADAERKSVRIFSHSRLIYDIMLRTKSVSAGCSAKCGHACVQKHFERTDYMSADAERKSVRIFSHSRLIYDIMLRTKSVSAGCSAKCGHACVQKHFERTDYMSADAERKSVRIFSHSRLIYDIMQ